MRLAPVTAKQTVTINWTHSTACTLHPTPWTSYGSEEDSSLNRIDFRIAQLKSYKQEEEDLVFLDGNAEEVEGLVDAGGGIPPP